jgi:ankyrin repeat protein
MDINNLDHISIVGQSVAPDNERPSSVDHAVSSSASTSSGVRRNVVNVKNSPLSLSRNLFPSTRPYPGQSKNIRAARSIFHPSAGKKSTCQAGMHIHDPGVVNARMMATRNLASKLTLNSSALMSATAAATRMNSRIVHPVAQRGAALCGNADAVEGDISTALARAAFRGDTATVARLLEMPGRDVNACNAMGNSALSRAVYYGHAEIVHLLLSQPDIDVHAGQPLLYAINGDQRDIVRQLLEFPSFDVNRDDGLAYAATLGNANILKMLLQAPGIEVNEAVWLGNSALTAAAEHGHEDVIRLLLQDGRVNLNAINACGDTALARAVKASRAKIVDDLLQTADIDPNQGGAIFLAATKGEWGLVDMLLCDPRIDVNAKSGALNGSDGGDSLLGIAAASGELAMVQRLLRNSKIDPDCGKPLFKAVAQQRWAILQALLADDRIDINGCNDAGESVLMLAVAKGQLDIVKCLLEVASIKVNQVDAQGNNALTIAARNGNADIVSSLLAREGIDPNLGAPMLLAATRNHWHIVEQLFWTPAINLNSVDEEGLTVLCHAIKSGRLREIKSLLARTDLDIHQGAPLILAARYKRVMIMRVLLADRSFESPLAAGQKDIALLIAHHNGSRTMVEMLRKHGANETWRMH